MDEIPEYLRLSDDEVSEREPLSETQRRFMIVCAGLCQTPEGAQKVPDEAEGGELVSQEWTPPATSSARAFLERTIQREPTAQAWTPPVNANAGEAIDRRNQRERAIEPPLNSRSPTPMSIIERIRAEANLRPAYLGKVSEDS